MYIQIMKIEQPLSLTYLLVLVDIFTDINVHMNGISLFPSYLTALQSMSVHFCSY
jgi:hypothetical protein